MATQLPLHDLLRDVRACRHCEKELPLGPRPVIQAAASARLLIVGQAPGTRVHASGIPWDDPSGERLRNWLGTDRETFYDPERVAIMPMGLCYPGRGKSGDLPPPAACATRWHDRVLQQLPQLELTLLVGNSAQQYYLNDGIKTLTERVRHWQDYLPDYLPLVHPSPRNQPWIKRNPWFEAELVPHLRSRVQSLLSASS